MDKNIKTVAYAIIKAGINGGEECKSTLNIFDDSVEELDLFFTHLGAALAKRQEIRNENDCRVMLIHYMSKIARGANYQIQKDD